MSNLTVSATDEKGKGSGISTQQSTDNFSGRIITVNGKITAAKTDVYQKLLSFLETVM